MNSKVLADRLVQILDQVDVLCKDVAPKVQLIGELREEAEYVAQELLARGIDPVQFAPKATLEEEGLKGGL